jgi:hypothetical protein
MSKLMIAMLAAAGISLAATAPATAATTSMAPMSKGGYDVAVKHADEQYKAEKAACGNLSGNAKDVCMEEAKGHEKVAKADAEAAYRNTPKTREAARLARADATYNVAKERCDDLAGNPKDVCVQEAKAILVKNQADAKVDRVSTETRQDATIKQADAMKAAGDDKRNANYKVAIEKCDALAGPAKDACVASAKVQYGKS